MLQLPFILEDRTGDLTDTDFDDIYDRVFLSLKQPRGSPFTRVIYKMTQRASRRRASLPLQSRPSVVLEFGPRATLGNISYVGQLTIPMSQYLRRTSLFAGSLSRKFIASDGREYRWSYKSIPGQEWSCVGEENNLVAHYDLRPPGIRAYGVSGNVLNISESSAYLSIELLASLTIMRHIAEHNL